MTEYYVRLAAKGTGLGLGQCGKAVLDCRTGDFAGVQCVGEGIQLPVPRLCHRRHFHLFRAVAGIKDSSAIRQ